MLRPVLLITPLITPIIIGALSTLPITPIIIGALSTLPITPLITAPVITSLRL